MALWRNSLFYATLWGNSRVFCTIFLPKCTIFLRRFHEIYVFSAPFYQNSLLFLDPLSKFILISVVLTKFAFFFGALQQNLPFFAVLSRNKLFLSAFFLCLIKFVIFCMIFYEICNLSEAFSQNLRFFYLFYRNSLLLLNPWSKIAFFLNFLTKFALFSRSVVKIRTLFRGSWRKLAFCLSQFDKIRMFFAILRRNSHSGFVCEFVFSGCFDEIRVFCDGL